jgi:hypothetical protein
VAVLFDLGLLGAISSSATALAQAAPLPPPALSVAFAAGPSAAPSANPQLVAECAELRAQLDRKTAEISALKRGERGVRQDYDLRQRMAEANDLARRLTALESQLAQQGHAPSPLPAGPPRPAAAAAPVEAASTLQARADLLSDEAHKLNERAAGMIRAAGQLRTRQALRRKAANVERDPFASVDGAKRTLFVRGTPLVGASDSKGAAQPGNTESAPGSAPTTTGTPNTSTPTPPAMPPNPGLAPMPTTAPTTPTAPPTGGTPVTAPQDPPGRGTTPAPTAAGGRSELAPGALLDPALRAELSRIDGGAARGSSEPESLEQAARALVSRAQALETQAKALRAQAASH